MGEHRRGGQGGGGGGYGGRGGHTRRGGSHSRWRLSGCAPLLWLLVALIVAYVIWRGTR
jgi:hypothetical protein